MLVKNSISSISNILNNEHLRIPEYQRPYKWKIKNVNQLIDDIIFQYNEDPNINYRVGTIVLHQKNNDIQLNIVDGQQRIITFTLIAHAMYESKLYNTDSKILDVFKFSNDISKINLCQNYAEIKRRIKNFDPKVVKYFYEKCELVCVVLNEISEAFQFFDSQNARGKDLKPHDLLKAYHLREMKDVHGNVKKKFVEDWQKIEENKLSELFGNYLFRIRRWSKRKNAKYFSKDDIAEFKGLNFDMGNKYQFSTIYYHANEFYKKQYPFQIDQPIINGSRFFEMIAHYFNLTDEIINKNNMENLVNDNAKNIINILNKYPGKDRIGDKYARNFFDCAILFYIDKFGKDNISDLSNAVEKFFALAYIKRASLFRMYVESIDNYAIDSGLFAEIKDMLSPSGLSNIGIPIITETNATNMGKVENILKKMGYINAKYK